MIKHHDIPNDELVRRLVAGEKRPVTWRKNLYLEWFSNANGRVVIQGTRLEVKRLSITEKLARGRRYNRRFAKNI